MNNYTYNMLHEYKVRFYKILSLNFYTDPPFNRDV